MQDFRLWAAVAAVSLLAGGCVPVSLEEDQVFRPRPVFDKAETPEDMRMDGEARLRHPDTIPEQLSGRAPATVSHYFVDLAGERIAVTRIKADSGAPDEPLIVSCGGNAADRTSTGAYYAEKLLPWGEVLLFDYPGYGDSSGRADVASVRAAAQAMGRYLDTQAAGRPLVAWGHSLGGFVCSEIAASSGEVDAVVLEATARNAEEAARGLTGAFGLFVRLNVSDSLRAFDIADRLEAFPGPILVLGAGADMVLPARLSRSLAQALQARGRAVTYREYPGAAHDQAALKPAFAQDGADFFRHVENRRTLAQGHS